MADVRMIAPEELREPLGYAMAALISVNEAELSARGIEFGPVDGELSCPYPVVMQRWEYKVVSLREGHYTDALNEYGRDGWELVSVASEAPRDVPAPERGGTLPMPRAFGVLGDAAARLNKLGAGDSTEAQAGPSSTLLWVLRRPLGED